MSTQDPARQKGALSWKTWAASLRKRKPRDFQSEIDAHLALEADELRSEGLSPAEAQAAARRALGNRTSVEERFYESGHWMLGQHLIRDLRFATRVLTKDAKFSVLAVLGLALAIGVSTAVFALANTLFHLGIEEVRNPESYVGLERPLTFPEYRYFQDRATAVGEISAESGQYNLVLGALSAGADAEDVAARFESKSSLSVRRLQPALGRVFTREDEQAGSAPVAMLSRRFWQRRFLADPGVLGRTIVLNAHAVTIVGIADPRFHQNDAAAVFLPLELQPLLLDRGEWLHDSGMEWLTVTARLRPGMRLPLAQAEADVLAKAFEQPASASSRTPHAWLLSPGGVNPSRRRTATAGLWGITLVVSMVLLVACSNLASLLLARTTARRREIGVRLSLGASRARLVSQLLTESLLLAILGGALGLVFSVWLAKALFVSLNSGTGINLNLDYRVLVYCVGLSAVIGISFGLGPALAATKTNLARALHAEGLAGTPSSPSRKLWTPRNLLVVLPLAASLMLLIAAAVMMQSIRRGQLAGPAFDTSRMIGISFRLKQQGYDEAKTLQFQEALRERIRALPGVTSVALATVLPLSSLGGGAPVCQVQIEEPTNSSRGLTVCNVVSTGFFETLGVPAIRGRTFSPADREGSAPVAMVNQELARRYWPGEDPIGKRIRQDSGSISFEVVGVASDLNTTRNELLVFPTVYVPSGQGNLFLTNQGSGIRNAARKPPPRYQADQMQFLVRANADPARVKAELRQAARAADPSLWVRIQTIEERLEPLTGPLRLVTLILSALGGLVLVMASVGIYALLAYAVSQRTHEIGVRMALGAGRREILSLVMQKTVVLIACGIALGLSGALVLTRILASRVQGAGKPGAITCIAVALVLGVVSLIASYLPARKAVRVDPVQALRCE